MNTSETLNRAADLIEERGWGQATGWHPAPGDTGPLCVEGALNATRGLRHKWTCPAWQAVADYIADRPGVLIHKGSGRPIVWVWNDRPERTAAEVIEVLRAAALIEAAREQETAWATYAGLVSA